jgi:hypothetical protein
MLLAAMHALQPNVLKVARATCPSAARLKKIWTIVSVAASSTRPIPSASASRPTLRGC